MSSIAIFSLSRSGSTLLNYAVKAAYPSYANAFEPDHIPLHISTAEQVIYKIVLDSVANFESLQRLQKCENTIVLTRDPRDRLISSLLFGLHGSGESEFDAAIEKLVRKEKQNSNYAFHQLVNDIYPSMNCTALNQYIQETYAKFSAIRALFPQAFYLKYEDLITGQVQKLESYLGCRLEIDIEIPERHSYAKRSAIPNQWKHWFIDDDVSIFKPILDPILSELDYQLDWQLEPLNELPAKHVSGFVKSARQKKHYFEDLNISWRDKL